jgi:nitrous oxidase accessory protein NosD
MGMSLAPTSHFFMSMSCLSGRPSLAGGVPRVLAFRSLTVALGLVISGFSLLVLLPNPASAQGIHAPIFIDGDANFTTGNGVISGSGTSNDPYVIQGWEISDIAVNRIEVRNTVSHFVVRGVTLRANETWGCPPCGSDIVFVNTTNGRVENSTLSGSPFSGGIFVSSSTDLVLSNNDITVFGQGYGITLDLSERVRIMNNHILIRDWGFGIQSASSRNNSITGNVIIGSTLFGWNPYEGILLSASEDTMVANNSFSSIRLSVHYSSRAALSNNSFSHGGIEISGGDLRHFTSHTITGDNFVDGRPVHYYKDCSGLTEDGVSVAQLFVANCTGVRVMNLQLDHVATGIQLAFVKGAIVEESNISESLMGLHIVASSNVSVRDIVLLRNGEGLGLELSSNVSIFHNSFLKNSAYELFGHENSWDNGYPSGGNYWADYIGKDECSGPAQDLCTGPDGIGDAPYQCSRECSLPGGGQLPIDRYPLFGPGQGDPKVIEVSIEPEKTHFAEGEAVTGAIFGSNPSAAPINLWFPYTGQSGLTVETCSSGVLYDGRSGGPWPTVSYLTLLPGETVRYPFYWNQSDSDGNPIPSPGRYFIRGWMLNAQVPPSPSIAITIGDLPPNSPPAARFDVLPSTGTAATSFAFDASGSTDSEYPAKCLEVRWDWNNDGAWDTPWSTLKVAEHQFLAPGGYTVNLEVRDPEGLLDNATAAVNVLSTLDQSPPEMRLDEPGAVTASGAFRISISVTDETAIAEVILHYRLPGETAFQISNMTPVGMGRYTAEIPLVETGRFDYYIVARDVAGNERQMPTTGFLSVTIERGISPRASILVVPAAVILVTAYVLSRRRRV